MPQRLRFRWEDRPINMLTGRYADCTTPKPATKDTSRRRPPITLKRMNEIAREFWNRKENRP